MGVLDIRLYKKKAIWLKYLKWKICTWGHVKPSLKGWELKNYQSQVKKKISNLRWIDSSKYKTSKSENLPVLTEILMNLS